VKRGCGVISQPAAILVRLRRDPGAAGGSLQSLAGSPWGCRRLHIQEALRGREGKLAAVQGVRCPSVHSRSSSWQAVLRLYAWPRSHCNRLGRSEKPPRHADCRARGKARLLPCVTVATRHHAYQRYNDTFPRRSCVPLHPLKVLRPFTRRKSVTATSSHPLFIVYHFCQRVSSEDRLHVSLQHTSRATFIAGSPIRHEVPSAEKWMVQELTRRVPRFVASCCIASLGMHGMRL
jgi:hypothetical protein